MSIKVTEITCPAVGMFVRVRRKPGKHAAGQVTWSECGAWRLAGSNHTYRTKDGDKIVYYSSKAFQSSKHKAAMAAPPVEGQAASLYARLLAAFRVFKRK